MKYYIIAGEASGDLHGSNLIKELKRLDAHADLRAWGGDLMQAAGAYIVKHYRDLAFMGFIEVIKNLPAILKNLDACKKDITAFRPDVLILIDYPGFNLRIAKWAKDQGIKVVYYISPQVWAWKENRVKSIKKVVDKMLVILPFEKEFYQTKWDYKVEYVGHPLVQVVNEFLMTYTGNTQPEKKIIALLPGSRKQEIKAKLPLMLQAAARFPQYQFIVAQASSLSNEFYQPFFAGYTNVSAVYNQTYALLAQATAALVTSGTATLETALFGVPQVVCYKGSPVSYAIARRLITIKYISLVNLIMDRPVVKELIQYELTVDNIEAELNALLFNEQRKKQLQQDYKELRDLLEQGGNASQKAAAIIIHFMNQNGAKV